MNNLTRSIFLSTLATLAALVPLPLGATEPLMTGGEILPEPKLSDFDLPITHQHQFIHAGDLDGDGCGDIFSCGEFSSISPSTYPSSNRGLAFSGKTGRKLWLMSMPGQVVSALNPGIYAASLPLMAVAAGDINGDRHDDVIVFGWNQFFPSSWDPLSVKEAVMAVSGVDGTALWLQTRVLLGNDGMVHGAMMVADRDADGQRDLAYFCTDGRLEFRSGKSGTLLLSTSISLKDHSGAYTGTQMSRSSMNPRNLQEFRDTNRDGIPEILMGFQEANRVLLLDGATGRHLRNLEGEDSVRDFGDALCVVPDQNGDGVVDIVIGAPNSTLNNSPGGKIYIYSGAQYTLLWAQASGSGVQDSFGGQIVDMGDLDYDGISDFAVSAKEHYVWPRIPSNNNSYGEVFIYSGKSRSVLWRSRTPDMEMNSVVGIFGYTLDAGDLDGDRRKELLIGNLFTIYPIKLPMRKTETLVTLAPLVGGTLEVTSGDRSGAKVVIPPNALTSDAVATIRLGEPPLGPAHASMGIGSAKSSLVECLPSQKFSRHVTLTLPLDQEASSSTLIRVKYFDEVSGQWVEVPGAQVTADRRHVTVEVDHFTVFGAFGESVGASSGGGSSGSSIGSSVAAALGGGGGGGGGCLIGSSASEGAHLVLLVAAVGLVAALSALLRHPDEGSGIQ